MDSNDWWESSEADLRAMDLCYNEQLYGLSAYHCQQALEKAIKSTALAHNLKIDTKEIGHDVLLSMFRKMFKVLTIMKEKGVGTEAQYISFQRTLNLLENVSTSIVDTDRKTDKEIIAAKDYLWGQSLNIPSENEKFEKFVNETETPMKNALNDAKLSGMTNVWNSDSDMKLSDLDRIVSKLHHDLGRSVNTQNAEQRILFWITPHINTVLKITPHEEYGRYPGSLCGQSRTELYRRCHKALRQLQSEVRSVINDLDKDVRRNSKISSTQ